MIDSFVLISTPLDYEENYRTGLPVNQDKDWLVLSMGLPIKTLTRRLSDEEKGTDSPFLKERGKGIGPI